MTARCPFCEAVHSIQPVLEACLRCPCGAMALLCAPRTEPDTAVRLADTGLSNTYAEVIDDTLSIVWAKERQWWTRHQWSYD